MKTPVDCIPCIIRQGLKAARLSTQNTELHHRVVDIIMAELMNHQLDKSPAIHSNLAYRVVRDVTGIVDPYHDLKKKYNLITLQMYQALKEHITNSDDRLHTAIKLAAVGNVIDLGIGNIFDLEKDIDFILKNGIARDDYQQFKEDIACANRILYLGDNAGEIVFDKLLVEELLRLRTGLEIVFVIKGGPIINDATIEDAIEVSMDKIVRIMTTGSDSIGIDWERTTEEFKTTFHQADIIISKGQGNFESLDECLENIYFILKAKCPCVAEQLKVNPYESVFLCHKRNCRKGERA